MDHKIFECEELFVKFSSCFVKLLSFGSTGAVSASKITITGAGQVAYRSDLSLSVGLAATHFPWTTRLKTFVICRPIIVPFNFFQLAAIVFLLFHHFIRKQLNGNERTKLWKWNSREISCKSDFTCFAIKIFIWRMGNWLKCSDFHEIPTDRKRARAAEDITIKHWADKFNIIRENKWFGLIRVN